MATIKVSLILPCYDEGPTFASSVKRIISQMQKIRSKWEIIFVEDKSTDETKRTVELFVSKFKNFRAIYHLQNQGRGQCVADGIRSAKGQICGYMDVDCEVSPAYIPLFLKEVEMGFDMAVGNRFYESGFKSFQRFIASKLYAWVVDFALKVPIADSEAGFKFFKRSRILPICAKVGNKHWFWDTEVCARAWWSGLKISQVPVLFIRRGDKKSTVKLFEDTIEYIINLIRLRLELTKRYHEQI